MEIIAPIPDQGPSFPVSGIMHHSMPEKSAIGWPLEDKSSFALLVGSLRHLQRFHGFQNPYTGTILLLSFTVVSVYLAYLIYFDYCDFLALGPGGTPADCLGYLRIKLLSLFALKDPYMPAPTPPVLHPQTGYLVSLPKRVGSRPVVKGIAPHRQQTQRPSNDVFTQLECRINALADDPTHRLVRGTSCFEKHGPGLFAVHPRVFAFSSYYTLSPMEEKGLRGAACLPLSRDVRPSSRPIQRRRSTPVNCPHEVCHAHPSDGSLHMTLHPADAKMVLQCGWGERHPLARGGWFERFVPGGFVMVYAPRTPEEVITVERIVKAAVWWIADETQEEEKGNGCD